MTSGEAPRPPEIQKSRTFSDAGEGFFRAARRGPLAEEPLWGCLFIIEACASSEGPEALADAIARDALASLARARDTVADPKAREEWTRRQRAGVLRRLLGENEAVPGV